MKRMFKIGDRVKIRKDSEYYGQFSGVGEIYSIGGGPLHYSVTSGEYDNSYSSDDLELYKINWREVL